MKRNWGLLLAGIVATIYSFAVGAPPVRPDGPAFMHPELARIIFFHLPCAWISSVLIFLASWLGIAYLKRRDERLDVRLAAATELGLLFGVCTMLTGILFSRVQWNAWWSWDPRQTSFLMVLLLFAALLALRAGITEESRRAAACSAYAVVMLLPAVFLIFVYPRLPSVTSLHPSARSLGDAKSLFDGAHLLGLLLVTVVMGWAANVLYRLRVRLGLLELDLVNNDGMDDPGSGGSSADRVVRPVAVRKEH